MTTFRIHVVFDKHVSNVFLHGTQDPILAQYTHPEVHVWTDAYNGVQIKALPDPFDAEVEVTMPSCRGKTLHVQCMSVLRNTTGALVRSLTGQAELPLKRFTRHGDTRHADLLSVASTSHTKYGVATVSFLKGPSPFVNPRLDTITYPRFRHGYRVNQGRQPCAPKLHDVFFDYVANTDISTCMTLNLHGDRPIQSEPALVRMNHILGKRIGKDISAMHTLAEKGEYLGLFWNALVNFNTYVMDWDVKRGRKVDVEKVSPNIGAGCANDCEDYAMFIAQWHGHLIRETWTTPEIKALADVARMYVPLAVLGLARSAYMTTQVSKPTPQAIEPYGPAKATPQAIEPYGHCYAQLIPVDFFESQLTEDCYLDKTIAWKRVHPQKLETLIIEGTALLNPSFHSRSGPTMCISPETKLFLEKTVSSVRNRVKMYAHSSENFYENQMIYMTPGIPSFAGYDIMLHVCCNVGVCKRLYRASLGMVCKERSSLISKDAYPILPGVVFTGKNERIFEFTPLQFDVVSRKVSTVYGNTFGKSIQTDTPGFLLEPHIYLKVKGATLLTKYPASLGMLVCCMIYVVWCNW